MDGENVGGGDERARSGEEWMGIVNSSAVF